METANICTVLIDETYEMDEDYFNKYFYPALYMMVAEFEKKGLYTIFIKAEGQFQKRVFWELKRIVEDDLRCFIKVVRTKNTFCTKK